jgi:DNA (cytosine-5)-methyltransferase 1|tara:strand:+ start:48 stop:866 length:819 start_codon:yes stop_codon:yes gene_type:complete
MRTVGSLFAGVGGMELGLQAAGWEVKWQVEQNEYCQKVLEKHWPDTPRWDDVTTFPPPDWSKELLEVDMLCGGWPCQDISNAGRKKGLKGERSGLFYEIIRLARYIRPQWLLLENVSGLLRRGMGEVLRSLAEIGYDAEWHCLSAAACTGAPHVRDRCFLICHVANTTSIGQQEPGTPGNARNQTPVITREAVESFNGSVRHLWESESELGRVATRIPNRLDRLTGLGNSCVPQVAEFIGMSILKFDKERRDERGLADRKQGTQPDALYGEG